MLIGTPISEFQNPIAAVYAPLEATGLGAQRWSSSAAQSLEHQIGAFYSQAKTAATNAASQQRLPLGSSLCLVINDEQHHLGDAPALSAKPKAKSTEPQQANARLSFKSQLQEVQRAMALSITQLSELLGVTRKSVYDWLDEKSSPRAGNTKRLEVIAEIVHSNSASLNLARLKGVWNMRVNGRSFRDVLADESLTDTARCEAITEKLSELSPRLGHSASAKNGTYLGNAHTADADRVSGLA